jgi:ABC-type multidrug transport system permease subunit
MYYIFESIALNEIGDGNYQCSAEHIVPRGATYNDTAFQTCAVSGSEPGNLNLSGNLYILAEYGFKYIHKWRNVGINAAFFVFFAILVTYVLPPSLWITLCPPLSSISLTKPG